MVEKLCRTFGTFIAYCLKLCGYDLNKSAENEVIPNEDFIKEQLANNVEIDKMPEEKVKEQELKITPNLIYEWLYGGEAGGTENG